MPVLPWAAVASGLFEGLTTVGVVGVLAFLGKTLVEAFFARQLESHRASLAAQSELALAASRAQQDAQLERLKVELQAAAVEHEVRFSRLHDRRAEVVARLYALAVECQLAAEELTSSMRILHTRSDETPETARARMESDLRQRMVDAGNAFNTYYRQHRLYLERPVQRLADDFKAELMTAWNDYIFPDFLRGDRREARIHEATEAARQRVAGTPMLLAALEVQFREILGVPEGSQHTRQEPGS